MRYDDYWSKSDSEVTSIMKAYTYIMQEKKASMQSNK